MNSKKNGYFISIGGGENQLPLINKALSKNARIITVDRNDIAPGFIHSQIKILESTHEYRKVLNGISQVPFTENILGIGCRSFGKACYTASYLAEKFNLLGSPSRSIRFLLDKRQYLEHFNSLGIRVPKIVNWTNKIDLIKKIKEFPFPIILKPNKGNSKIGINFISNIEDLKTLIESNHPSPDRFIIQEYIPGDEVTVLGLVGKSDFHLLSVSDKVTTDYPPFLEIAHVLPSIHSNSIGEIDRIMNFLSKYLSLSYTPLLAEFKITTEGDIYLMEIAPEVGGEFLADYLIPEFYNIDYFEILYEVLTNRNFDFKKLEEALRTYKANECAMVFRVPSKFSSISKSLIEFPTTPCEEIFFQKELLPDGTKVKLSMGNLSRNYVLGISRRLSANGDGRNEWLNSIVNRLGEGYN